MSEEFVSENLRVAEEKSPHSTGESPGTIRVVQDVIAPNGNMYEVFSNPETGEMALYRAVQDDSGKEGDFNVRALDLREIAGGELIIDGVRVIPYREGKRGDHCLEDISYYRDEAMDGIVGIRNNLVLPQDPQVNDAYPTDESSIALRFREELGVAKLASTKAAELTTEAMRQLPRHARSDSGFQLTGH